VKIYNPVQQSQFMWRDLHNMCGNLCLALYHEFEDDIPDSGEFNVGYFEGKQQ